MLLTEASGTTLAVATEAAVESRTYLPLDRQLAALPWAVPSTTTRKAGEQDR
jgi:hypothetical protein